MDVISESFLLFKQAHNNLLKSLFQQQRQHNSHNHYHNYHYHSKLTGIKCGLFADVCSVHGGTFQHTTTPHLLRGSADISICTCILGECTDFCEDARISMSYSITIIYRKELNVT